MPNSENVMRLGYVETFPGASPTKEQALKVVEEAAEVFGAWQAWGRPLDEGGGDWLALFDECADLLTATANLLAGFEVADFERYLERARERNVARGRYEVVA